MCSAPSIVIKEPFHKYGVGAAEPEAWYVLRFGYPVQSVDPVYPNLVVNFRFALGHGLKFFGNLDQFPGSC